MIDRFKKGKRVYTRWDNKSEQVTVPSRKRQTGPVPPAVEIQAPVPDGRPATEFIIHHRADEFVIDFIFVTGAVGRIVSRIIMKPSAAKKFCALLRDHSHA
jgi:hypothetical protein